MSSELEFTYHRAIIVAGNGNVDNGTFIPTEDTIVRLKFAAFEYHRNAAGSIIIACGGRAPATTVISEEENTPLSQRMKEYLVNEMFVAEASICEESAGSSLIESLIYARDLLESITNRSCSIINGSGREVEFCSQVIVVCSAYQQNKIEKIGNIVLRKYHRLELKVKSPLRYVGVPAAPHSIEALQEKIDHRFNPNQVLDILRHFPLPPLEQVARGIWVAPPTERVGEWLETAIAHLHVKIVQSLLNYAPAPTTKQIQWLSTKIADVRAQVILQQLAPFLKEEKISPRPTSKVAPSIALARRKSTPK